VAVVSASGYKRTFPRWYQAVYPVLKIQYRRERGDWNESKKYPNEAFAEIAVLNRASNLGCLGEKVESPVWQD